jgi:hypothetical protein
MNQIIRIDDRTELVILPMPSAHRTHEDDRNLMSYYFEWVEYTDGGRATSPVFNNFASREAAEQDARFKLSIAPWPALKERPQAPPAKPAHWHQHVCFQGDGLLDCVNPLCFKPGQRMLTDQVVCPVCGEITGRELYLNDPRTNEYMPATPAPDTTGPDLQTIPPIGRFPLGRVVVTPGALDTLEQLNLNGFDLLSRHHQGDWSEMSADDKAENEFSIDKELRIFSSYKLGENSKLWIITEADRSATTLLLPEEY